MNKGRCTFRHNTTRQTHYKTSAVDRMRQRNKHKVVVRERQVVSEHFDVPKMLQPKFGFRAPLTSPQKHKKHSRPNQMGQTGRGKKMDSRGIEPRTTPRIGFEAHCTYEMLREYYTTKPRARELSCHSFDERSCLNSLYNADHKNCYRNAV